MLQSGKFKGCYTFSWINGSWSKYSSPSTSRVYPLTCPLISQLIASYRFITFLWSILCPVSTILSRHRARTSTVHPLVTTVTVPVFVPHWAVSTTILFPPENRAPVCVVLNVPVSVCPLYGLGGVHPTSTKSQSGASRRQVASHHTHPSHSSSQLGIPSPQYPHVTAREHSIVHQLVATVTVPVFIHHCAVSTTSLLPEIRAPVCAVLNVPVTVSPLYGLAGSQLTVTYEQSGTSNWQNSSHQSQGTVLPSSQFSPVSNTLFPHTTGQSGSVPIGQLSLHVPSLLQSGSKSHVHELFIVWHCLAHYL